MRCDFFIKFNAAVISALMMLGGCSSNQTTTDEPVATGAVDDEDVIDSDEVGAEMMMPPALSEEPTDQDIGTLDSAPTNVADDMPMPSDLSAIDDAPVESQHSTLAALATGDLEYIVMPGDTLGKIAKRLYGSAKRYTDLAEQNQLVDANKIYPGDRIRYASTEAVGRYKNDSGQIAKTTTIKRGESLSKLALRLYGHANYWRLIWKYNLEQIPNPNRVDVGQSLSYIVIPRDKAITH